MEKIWLNHYPKDVPPEINPDEYASLVDLLLTACRKYAKKPAFSSFGVKMTYQSLDEKSADFAAFCQQELKLKKGERIAIMMPNCLQYPIAILGALRAGLTVVNVNPLYTARELRHQLNDADTSAILVIENFAHTLETALVECKPHHVIMTKLGDCLGQPKGFLINIISKYVKKLIPTWHIPSAISFKDAMKRGAYCQLVTDELSGEDLAFLQYTGGTTGVAKGAMLTHRNMVANALQASTWVTPNTREGEEIIITALPLYHIFSLTANCMTFMLRGGENVLITNPRDMPMFIKLIKKLPFTAITGVNTLFNGLLNQPGFKNCNLSSLRMALGGGMAVQHSVAKRWQEVTGVPLVQAYGLTETAPAVCINPLDIKEYSPSVGLPVPSTDIRVVDENGNDVALGEPGELWVKGPQVMAGYWQRPEATEEVMSDGWFKTGDVVTVDDKGFVTIVDRIKDMIIVSGFNVYPNEVEDVIAACPGVEEVGVVGEPNGESGESVKAVIVKSDPALTESDVESYCRAHLTGYKIPKQIEFVDELPKTPVGKILRRALRDQMAA